MEEDLIDKEEVRGIFRRYHKSPEGFLNATRQDRETGVSRGGSMRGAPVVELSTYQFPRPGFQHASNAYIGLGYSPPGTFLPPHLYQIYTGYAPLPSNLLSPCLYQINSGYAQHPSPQVLPNAWHGSLVIA
jgi:hypothetical protein